MLTLLAMADEVIYQGYKYVRLEKLAYGHQSDGTSRKKLFHDVYVLHDGIPAVFVRGCTVLRSQQEADFIREKLKLGLLYALEKYTTENHSSYWKR